MFKKFASFKKKKTDSDSQSNLSIDETRRSSATPDTPEFSQGLRHTTASDVSLPFSQHKLTTTTAEPALAATNKGAESGPLGLSIVYTPDNAHKVDIIFVHGLGGTSRWSWSMNREPELFWPLTFLPLEPDICLARIMTFGYNASFQKSGNITTSILDFAKDLLFDLRYAKGPNMEELDMGRVPVIFVVHSMGGLIVKEAYMQGQNDPEYEAIIKSISAITFLATPHRGTTLAQTLNRILDSVPVMLTNSKQYVADLGKNSLTLQKLNEQFRHIAPRLDIVSFYETMPTAVAKSARVMVLEKDSSVLGYPGEVSKALDADHHSVCKYTSPQDPNYITVRNVLKSLVSKIVLKDNAQNKPDLSDRKASLDLKSLLAISDSPGTDYIFFKDQWTQGTNDWILNDKTFIDWRDTPSNSKSGEPNHGLLWLSGGAATGKSVLSAFLVNHLVEEGFWCQYFFIRFADRQKRTLSLLLRSLAYQLALCVPGFLQKVIELTSEAIDFETADPRIIWDCIFKAKLFKWEEQAKPLFWVIDGLDEAQTPRTVVKLLSEISSSSGPIRILFTSRRTSEITMALDRLPQSFALGRISIEGHLDDLRQHVRQELAVSGSPSFKAEIERRIIEGSQNNFLWVRLAVDRVNYCHTHADVDEALQELPSGMAAIYDRMASAVIHIPNLTNRTLAMRILEYASCSLRALTVAELSQALEGIQLTSEMLDFQRTIADLSGGFVVIDNDGNVSMIHQTAREYLLNDTGLDTLDGNETPVRRLCIDSQAAHRQIFLSCAVCLMSIGLRGKISRKEEPEFLEYAASSWSSHLVLTSCDRDTVISLKKFLTGHWILTWIQVLAASGHFPGLIRASKDLSTFASKLKVKLLEQDLEAATELDISIFEGWAVDLMRIVGKFSNLLRRKPDSIYKFIPPLCPKGSMLYQQFGKAEARNLSVTGLSTETWDDSLARISLGHHGPTTFASCIAAAGSQIAILVPSGSTFLYDSSDFTEKGVSPIKHGERVDTMQLNSTATLLATYGYHTTKVWDISTGNCIVSVNSVESKARPLAMTFTANNSTLVVGTDDRRIRSLTLTKPDPEWEVVAELDEQELEGQFMVMNSASHIALNKDGSMAAIAYRSHPLSAWEVDGSVHVGHCWRKDEAVAIRELRELVWHPHMPQIVGLNLEGVVFKWSPYDGSIDELHLAATKLTLSKDGDLFATGDGHGRVKLYTTSTFSLLYQLSAQDSVFGLTFSPDSRRLYDLRGYYANAWEPPVLTRMAEHSGKHVMDSESDHHSLALSASEAQVVISRAVDAITAVAGSPNGRLYCCGTERGIVSIYDTQRGRLLELHASRAKFTIEKVVWSNDGKFICFTDMSKQVTIMSVTQGTGKAEPVVERKAVIPLRSVAKGSILQLLFQSDSSRILVHTTSQLCTISLETSSVEASRDLADTRIDQCIAHPRDPALIVFFGVRLVCVLDWDLVERRQYNMEWPLIDVPFDEEPGLKVDRVLVAQDKRHILLQVSGLEGNSRANKFFSLETSTVSITPVGREKLPSTQEPNDSGDPQSHLIHLNAVATDISSAIAVVLSFIFKDRLVFISRNFGVCSVQIPWVQDSGRLSVPNLDTQSGGTVMAARRHSGTKGMQGIVQELFALPGDWISRDCLMLCCVWAAEKSLFCPRNGEVAVVKCAALA